MGNLQVGKGGLPPLLEWNLMVGKGGLPPLVECHSSSGGKPPFPNLQISATWMAPLRLTPYSGLPIVSTLLDKSN